MRDGADIVEKYVVDDDADGELCDGDDHNEWWDDENDEVEGNGDDVNLPIKDIFVSMGWKVKEARRK